MKVAELVEALRMLPPDLEVMSLEEAHYVETSTPVVIQIDPRTGWLWADALRHQRGYHADAPITVVSVSEGSSPAPDVPM